MGGCQNDAPFLGPYYNTAPNIQVTQKRDHDFDNHPHVFLMWLRTCRLQGHANHGCQVHLYISTIVIIILIIIIRIKGIVIAMKDNNNTSNNGNDKIRAIIKMIPIRIRMVIIVPQTQTWIPKQLLLL